MFTQRIARSAAVLSLLLSSLAAQAELISVADALQQPVGSSVEVQGQMVAQHGISYFGFSDGSAEFEVHVTDAAWEQVDVIGPEDKLVLQGDLRSDSEHPFYLDVVSMKIEH